MTDTEKWLMCGCFNELGKPCDRCNTLESISRHACDAAMDTILKGLAGEINERET